MATHSIRTSDPTGRSSCLCRTHKKDWAEAIAELRAVLGRQLVSQNDAGYDAARRIWNGAVDNHPALIVRCVSAGDVQATPRTAREHRLPISVRSGGLGGPIGPRGGIVIDLSAMRQVTVDPQARTATLQGGSTADDVLAAAEAHGLAAVTGAIGSIGMAVALPLPVAMAL